MRIGVRCARDSLIGSVSDRSGNPIIERQITAGSDLRADTARLISEILGIARSSFPDLDGVAPSIVFELSDLLEQSDAGTPVVVRIAPRAPADAAHESRVAPEATRIVHVSGGRTSLGEELVPLDEVGLRGALAEIEPGARYIVTGVGAVVDPTHERRAGELILQHAAPSGIEYSHGFPDSSFAVRERTALMNSALIPRAEELVTALSLGVGEVAPPARLYVCTNSGGCAPLQRLSRWPVHSRYSGEPAVLIAAAALAGATSGSLLVETPAGLALTELDHGVPTGAPQRIDDSGQVLASHSATLMLSPDPVSVEVFSSPRHAVASSSAIAGFAGFVTTPVPECDLGALGAAVSPLTYWEHSVVQVGSAEEMRESLSAVRARASARLVSFGAAPSRVRILESRVVATAYEHRRVVSVRVRGIASLRPEHRAEEDPRAA